MSTPHAVDVLVPLARADTMAESAADRRAFLTAIGMGADSADVDRHLSMKEDRK